MERGLALGACLHTTPSKDSPHGKLKSRQEFNCDIDFIKHMQKEGRMKSGGPSEKVGYPSKDARYVLPKPRIYATYVRCRPHSKANRAGTRGFRAPEVLLKCGEQSGGARNVYLLHTSR